MIHGIILVSKPELFYNEGWFYFRKIGGKEYKVLDKGKRTRFLVVMSIILVLLLVSIIITYKGDTHHETVKEAMRDAVLHGENRINFFGLSVNPSLISAYLVTAILLVMALIIRIFFIPRFGLVPGKFQALIEMWVGYFDNLAKTSSPHLNSVLGAYVFTAGSYIFLGTIFELFGIQGITTEGYSISLPAPLADINGAIAMGVFSYTFILSGGVWANKLKGVGLTLKEFSLPISMSFRLFGALLSGALVTDLIYHASVTSYGIPVIVGVLFTILHALIQAYVLTTIASTYFGEVTEPSVKKPKKAKKASA